MKYDQEHWHNQHLVTVAFPCSVEGAQYLTEVAENSLLAYVSAHRHELTLAMKDHIVDVVRKMGSVTILQRNSRDATNAEH